VQSAKKKPRLQELINRLPELTESDIESLSEQRWIKEALIILKNRNGISQKPFLQELTAKYKARLDDLSNHAATVKIPVYQWSGGTRQIPEIGHSNSQLTFEINDGDVMMIDFPNLYVKGVVKKINQNILNIIVPNSHYINDLTHSEYTTLYRKILDSRL
jgi:hypothetical protein